METKRKSARVVVSLLALAGLAVFSLFAVGGSLQPSVPPGPTMKTLDEVEPRVPIHASDLPLTITEPNSYYLVEDIHFTSTLNHAITIECNDVTIDLMGYQLIGPGSGTGSGIYMHGRRNIEVRNGTVRSFSQTGIYEAGAQGRNHRLLNIRALSNSMLGILLQGQGHLVKDCTAAANGSTGIYAGSASTITGNTIYQNEGYGLSAGASTITGNTITGNDDAGILAGSRSLVAGNTISGNNQSNGLTQAGISVDESCLIRDNAINYNNQNDIYVSGFGNCLEQNLLTNSAGNGIYFSATQNFYANNRAHGHTTAYANTAGNTDGGGNISF